LQNRLFKLSKIHFSHFPITANRQQ
jgi:hypothetical protein